MRRTSILLLTVLLVTAAACGSDDEPVRSGDGPRDRPADGDGAAPRPGGRDDGLFISIGYEGGFMPVGHDFRSLPTAVVHDDGTTFSPGAVIEIYPGPAVLPVVEGSLASEQLQEVANAAADAGLLTDEAHDFGEPPIADAATTVITVVADGQTYTTSVYALGDTGGPGLPGADEQPGIDEDAAAAREQVAAFVDQVSRMVTEAEEAQWEPDRFRVLPVPADPGATPPEGVDPDVRDWPFDDVSLVERQCAALEGERAERFAEIVADATEITQWRTGDDHTFQLFIRPVLPHEPGCPE